MKRLLSIDIFRGITIFFMILVNTQAGGSFDFLIHIPGYGWRIADLVYPSFIFIMGASMYLSMRKYVEAPPTDLYKHIFRRTVLIFLMGIIFNWIPFDQNLLDVRILGVLQRIAIVYLICSLLVIKVRSIPTLLSISGLILGFYYLLTMKGYEIVDAVDLAIIGTKHMYTPTHDPEGLLSSIPSVVNAIIGYVSARILTENELKERLIKMSTIAISMIALAYILHWTILPIYKTYWSSSFGLLTSGISLLAWIVVHLICDVWGKKDWGIAFDVLGKNSIVCYLLSALIAEFFRKYGIADDIISFYQGVMSQQFVSLSWGLTVVLLCLLAGYPLYVKKIYIKL